MLSCLLPLPMSLRLISNVKFLPVSTCMRLRNARRRHYLWTFLATLDTKSCFGKRSEFKLQHESHARFNHSHFHPFFFPCLSSSFAFSVKFVVGGKLFQFMKCLEAREELYVTAVTSRLLLWGAKFLALMH